MMQTNFTEATDNLSDPPQHYLSSFTADNNARHDDPQNYCFSLPNPQIQNHHLLFNNNNNNIIIPHLLHQQQSAQTIIHFNNRHLSSPQYSDLHQPWELIRSREEAIAVADQSLLRNKLLGLVSSDNNNDDSSCVFAHHEIGLLHQKFMPRISRQPQEYSTAKQQPFTWNNNDDKNHSVMDDVSIRENSIIVRNNEEVVLGKHNNTNRLYGELEAIYGLVNNNVGDTSYNNQTGSTSENSPAVAEPNPAAAVICDDRVEASKKSEQAKKRKKRKKTKAIFRSVTRFFESLVGSVMTHQDRLHGSFLEAVERIDRERRERDEARRCEEARARDREAAARARERARASDREALVVSYLEKIAAGLRVPGSNTLGPPEESTSNVVIDGRQRWPGSEIEALVRVMRSGLVREETSDDVWEEVSGLMTRMGYKRSAKRCKEKWDNISNYFTKTSTTWLSSSSTINHCPTKPLVISGFGAQMQSYMELLKAFTTTTTTQPSTSFEKVGFEDEFIEEEDEDEDDIYR